MRNPKFEESMLDKELNAFAEAISVGMRHLDITIEVESECQKSHLKLIDKIDAGYHGRYWFDDPDVWDNHEIPFSNSPGVYFFFNKDRVALIVGHTRHLGGRVEFRINNDNLGEAQYVVVIPFEKAPFIAPAFVAYLLHKYTFTGNRNRQ